MYEVTINKKNSPKRRWSDRKKSTKKSKKGLRSIIIMLIIIIVVLGAGGFALKKFAESYEGESSIINPIVNTIEPKLKQDNGHTNILIVGIDTRESNSGLMNTDTLIFTTIDYENKSIVMTSIPRDLWVKYTLPNGNTASSKVNSAYASGEWQEEGAGMETLIGALEQIFDEPVHYHVKVTLKGFVEIVDTLGGIDVEVPEFYKDAYPYEELPPEYQQNCAHYYHDGHYCIFTFDAGTQHLDGQHALIYARCRLLSPTGDFDRARRQQRVIDSVKNTILSSETLLDPTKLWEMYQIVNDNIETSEFSVNDIRAALNLTSEFDLDNIGNVVLDPYLGHAPGKYIYRPTTNLERGYYIEAKDQTYQDIRDLLEYIRKYPTIYNEAVNISLYNATGTTLPEDYVAMIEEDHPLFSWKQTNRVLANPNGQYTGIQVYKFTQDEKPGTEKYLKEFFELEEIITEFDNGLVNYSQEDYVIVVGVEETSPVDSE